MFLWDMSPTKFEDFVLEELESLCGITIDNESRSARIASKIALLKLLMLNVVFWRLLCLGSFPACWRLANITPIPKGPPSSSVANYQPILKNISVVKVVCVFLSARLGRFMAISGVLPTT